MAKGGTASPSVGVRGGVLPLHASPWNAPRGAWTACPLPFCPLSLAEPCRRRPRRAPCRVDTRRACPGARVVGALAPSVSPGRLVSGPTIPHASSFHSCVSFEEWWWGPRATVAKLLFLELVTFEDVELELQIRRVEAPGALGRLHTEVMLQNCGNVIALSKDRLGPTGGRTGKLSCRFVRTGSSSVCSGPCQKRELPECVWIDL